MKNQQITLLIPALAAIWGFALVGAPTTLQAHTKAQTKSQIQAQVTAQPVTVTVAKEGSGAALPAGFVGLSYDTSRILPQSGQYYFDPNDQALINTFQTLGIKSLRIGGSSTDNTSTPIPQEADIDSLFQFAQAAGVKVIYSFRGLNGDPADSASKAQYIMANYANELDCFAIGNEPNSETVNSVALTYAEFLTEWEATYNAILQAVPNAMFEGPSASNADDGGKTWITKIVKDIYPGGHLTMVSNHYYFFGEGDAGTAEEFLSNDDYTTYGKQYAWMLTDLVSKGVPYRMDETNNCWAGGSAGVSNSYAATLWALDYAHWWASQYNPGMVGMNFNTGTDVGQGYYTAFVPDPDGGYDMLPPAYGYWAFNLGAHGQPLAVTAQSTTGYNFSAYAYQDADGSIYVTLINKNYGATAQTASVSLQLPPSTGLTGLGTWEEMDLVQANQDVTAQTGITLGGATINTQGIGSPTWENIEGGYTGSLTVQVAPASASILHFVPL